MLEDDVAFLEELRVTIDKYLFLGFAPAGGSPGGDPALDETAKALEKPEFQALRRKINEAKPRAKEIINRFKIPAVYTQHAPLGFGGGAMGSQHLLDIVTDNRMWQRFEKGKILDTIDQAIGGIKVEIQKGDQGSESIAEGLNRSANPRAPETITRSAVKRKRPWYASGWVKGIAAIVTILGLVRFGLEMLDRFETDRLRAGQSPSINPEFIQVFFSEWQIRFRSGETIKPPVPIIQDQPIQLRLAIQDDNLPGPRIRNIYLRFPEDTEVEPGQWAGRFWVKSNALGVNEYFYQFDNNVPNGEAQFLAPISVSFKSSGVKQIGLHITVDDIESLRRHFLFEVTPKGSPE